MSREPIQAVAIERDFFQDKSKRNGQTSMYSRLGLLASLVILLSMLALRAIYSKVKISRR